MPRTPEPTRNEIDDATQSLDENLRAFCLALNCMPADVELNGPLLFKCKQSSIIWLLLKDHKFARTPITLSAVQDANTCSKEELDAADAVLRRVQQASFDGCEHKRSANLY